MAIFFFSRAALLVALATSAKALSETPAFHPGQPMYDTAGNQIDAHGGGFLVDNGTTYWYGSARLNHPDNECVPVPGQPPKLCDKGINLYSSTDDLYTWKFESQVVAALNRTNGRDIERPKVIKCPKTQLYVMWLRGTPIYAPATLLKAGVLTAPTPHGPWSWVAAAKSNDNDNDDGGDGGDDDDSPFFLVDGKYQYGDATLYQDPATLTTYVYWRARTTEAGFRAMELDDTCTGVRSETDTQIFTSPNREAPAFFEHDGSRYLWTSGTLGWSPVQAYVYRSTGPSSSPLGPFNASLGHGWHAYVKPPDFNATRTYTVRDGYLPAGHDLPPTFNTTTNFATAAAACAGAAACQGFTFRAYDRQPPASELLKVSFKTDGRVVPEGDPEGLQPPPIPEPGDPGNDKSGGQPGIFSFGSQSTYILPNPKWRGPHTPSPTPGRAPFVYLADRWQPDTPNFGLYVWLPLFVDTRDPRHPRVRVVWQDEWRLDDNGLSPF